MRIARPACLLAYVVALVYAFAIPVACASPLASTPVGDLGDVLVTGLQPGPGLWHVSDGDHDLWILGSLSPLPKALQWHASQLESLLGRSQALIAPPEARLSVSTFRALLLVPVWLQARRNPGKQTLHDVLPAEVYAHWIVLKARYLAQDDAIEHLRPVVASYELYRKALGKADLTTDDLVWRKVRAVARAKRVPITTIDVDGTIADPRGALHQWEALPPAAEASCFADTLDRLERDIAQMRSRANLWAVGDVPGLRNVVDSNPEATCLGLLRGVAAFDDPVQRMRRQEEDAWMATATAALAANQSTVAVLPIARLLEPDGVLARLRERGLVVSEP
jgi:uncharacterized protein YbaP (TraB family)